MPAPLDQKELLRLARLGAESRLAELRNEIRAIEALLATRPQGPGRTRRATAANAASAGRRVRRRPVWSAAKRRAAALRMKRYWAKRRGAAKAAGKTAATKK